LGLLAGERSLRRTNLFVPRMDYVKQRGAIYFIDAAAAQTLN
jgi:hypothetical protein